MEEARLTIEIENKRPIELVDLTKNRLLGFALTGTANSWKQKMLNAR